MEEITYSNYNCDWNRYAKSRTICPCGSDDRDVQIDFYPAPCRNPVVWGTVFDDCNRPLSGSLIQLLQCSDEGNACCMVIGETYSDCNGRYEIQIPSSCRGKYRIEVSNPCENRKPGRGKNNICYY